MRRIVVVVASFLIGTTALAQSRTLTAAEIRAELIGRSITGVENGRPYTETLLRSGRIAGRDADGRYTGRWTIQGERLCFLYDDADDDDDDEDEWDCSSVRLDGSRITFVTPGEPNESATLLDRAP